MAVNDMFLHLISYLRLPCYLGKLTFLSRVPFSVVPEFSEISLPGASNWWNLLHYELTSCIPSMMAHLLSFKNHLESKENELQMLYISFNEYIISGTRLYHLVALTD